jgi:nucleotide-binding universal stress UspA family protein
MIRTAMQMTSITSARDASEDGPVLLAATPFGGMDAPIAAARWYAAHEQRDLRVVAALEREEPRATAAAQPPLPLDCGDMRRRMLIEQLRRELMQHGLDEDAPVQLLDDCSAKAVVEVARQRGAPLIVVGTGRQDGGGLAHGELAMQIVSAADRPVLVVPSDATNTSADVAVVAVDFSPASVRAAREVMPLLSFGGRLILVHVRSAVSLKQDTAEWWDDLYARRCAELLVEFRRQLRPRAGITVETRFLRGEAAGTVAAFAAGCGAGLIACGRKRHTALERALKGGVSSRLINYATCPVLVVPESPGDVANR